jgi:ABC-type Fe3+/spermidine/putrescine transport system ATPase subunit
MTQDGVSFSGTAAALELDAISKSFGSTTALREISIRLERGEFLTLLGPSGSGKTTTLRIIAGFLKPDRGAVRLHGRDVLVLPPYRRNIGMVFQDYALFPHMTVAANVPSKRGAYVAAGARRWSRKCWPWSASKVLPIDCRVSFRVGSSSASRSLVRSCSIPNWCSSTSHSAPSTRSCGVPCSSRSSAS